MVRNLIGQKFNRLTVIRLFKKRMYKNCRDAGWRCRCDCGNFANVLGSSLVNGRTKSCGCFHKEQQKKVREIDAPRNKYNGIDRLDSTEGYTTDNCVSCCTTCNWMKKKMPLEKFLQKVKEIAIYRRLL